ncbi:HD domain-containing protein [Agrilactobacillus composti]|uniref:HD domain-containing protein n=1 Tax=Agrilactobacillus composti TaxID=398555 RepID=UPI00070510C7|nr:HD domain-containing protein [Agrilactobacillus composti]
MSEKSWQNDSEYVALVSDLLQRDEVLKLAEFTQHYYSNRLEHSIHVSYRSYLLGKKLNLNTRALARAGLLHDLFYYDWRNTKFDLGTHAYVHPRIALRNAEKLTDLTPMEKDIIIKHMFGATLALPKYKESWVVTLVDDYCALEEVGDPLYHRAAAKIKRRFGVSIS